MAIRQFYLHVILITLLGYSSQNKINLNNDSIYKFLKRYPIKMNLLMSKKLEIASAISFALFFILNFIDRSIGNIFLLITLILCIINYNILYRSIKSNIKLFVSIILFTTYITLSGIYHGAPMHELDNYYRFYC